MRIPGILLIALLWTATGNAVNECDPSFIGLTTDEYGSGGCCIEMPLYQPTSIYFAAPLTACMAGFTELSFRIPNWPESGYEAGGLIHCDWYADDVEGDLSTGITLRWNEPNILHETPHVGRIEFLPFAEHWLNPEIWLTPEDISYETSGTCFQDPHPIDFVINGDCGIYWECDWNQEGYPPDYDDYLLWTENVDPPNHSVVPGDFDLSFDVWSHACDYDFGLSFWGEVLLDQSPIAEFQGQGTESIEIPIDLSEYDIGDELAVCIDVWIYGYMGHPQHHRHWLSYTVGQPTAIHDDSWSALKIRY